MSMAYFLAIHRNTDFRFSGNMSSMRKRSLDIRMKYLADFMGDKTEGFIQGSPVSAYPLADFIPSRPKSGDNTKGLIQGNPLSAYSLATPPMTPQSPSDNWNIWRNVL